MEASHVTEPISRPKIVLRVRRCLARLGLDDWPDKELFCDIAGWDSLRQARLIIELQREFQISFEVVEMESLINLDTATRIIERHFER